VLCMVLVCTGFLDCVFCKDVHCVGADVGMLLCSALIAGPCGGSAYLHSLSGL
jgi:hypothetical protein